MRIEYLAFPTDKYPCFGFLVCTENGIKQYLPEYNEEDTICNFEETKFDTMYLQKYNGTKSIIKKGEKRLYVYRLLNDKNPIIGTIDNIRTQLTQELSRIQDAPFSKLELAEFLNVDNHILTTIKNECYIFLKEIDEEYAKQWARDNSLNEKYAEQYFADYDLLDEEFSEKLPEYNHFELKTFHHENNINVIKISRVTSKKSRGKYVYTAYINKPYILKLNNSDLSILEKQNKAFPVKLNVRKKKYPKKKTTVVSKKNKQYEFKLDINDILMLEKQNKAFSVKINDKNKKKLEQRRLRSLKSRH